MMRVLVLSHMFPRSEEDWGGIFVFEQVKALRVLGIDARTAVGNPVWVPWRQRRLAAKNISKFFLERPSRAWTELRGVPILYFPYLAPPLSLWGRLAARSYRFGLARLLRDLAREFPFDLVHAHTAFMDGTAGAYAARALHVPFLLTEHTGPFTAITEQLPMRRQTESSLNAADLVISVSKKLKSDILREVHVNRPERMRVIGNGFDPEIFYPNEISPPEDGTVRALWIGGFLPVKQPIMLIDGFAQAVARDPRLRLSLVGYGVLEEAVRARVAEHRLGDLVEFYPSASRQQIADHIRQHHFLVISSETETFGLVAVEALGCGRPVLTTRCGGPEETVQDSSRGEIVENSALGISAGLVSIASRIGEFDTLSLAEYARAHYSFSNIAAQIRELYQCHLHCEH